MSPKLCVAVNKLKFQKKERERGAVKLQAEFQKKE